MKIVTVADAVAHVQKELDEAVAKAAKDDVLSKTEQTKLPWFARHVLDDFRKTHPGKLTVKSAQKELATPIQQAIAAGGLATATQPAALGVITLLSAGQIDESEIAEMVQAHIKKTGVADASVSPLMEGAWLSDFADALDELSDVTYDDAQKVPAAFGPMIVTASNASTYASTTVKELLDQADDGEVRVRELRDPDGGAEFVVVDYGAGDNTFGAIFDKATAKLLAEVIDGNIELR